MSHFFASAPLPVAPAWPWRPLTGLTLLVLAAHAGLVGGLGGVGAWQRGETTYPTEIATAAFETRTLTLPAPAPTPVVQRAAAVPVLREVAQPPTVSPTASDEPNPSPDGPPPDGHDGKALAVAATAFASAAALADDNPTAALPIPPAKRLLYDVKAEAKGFGFSAKGELLWAHDGKNYDARMEISHFLLGSRVQTSKGAITPRGLEPLRFGDKTRRESEVAAHFQRDKGKVSFSANTPDATLEPGAQDNLSVFMQLAGLLAANNGRFPGGNSATFQAIGPRSAETWVFKFVQTETLKLPGGELQTIKLTRDAVNENDARAEMWLAPALGYLPARIRLSQKDEVVDQLWRSTQNP